MSRFGFDLLQEQILHIVNARCEFIINSKLIGESAIEQLFFAALTLAMKFCQAPYTNMMVVPERRTFQDTVDLIPNNLDEWLIIEHQHQLDGWRVDFLISALDCSSKPNKPIWRKLIVECDGHDFHERTKEQATKDRSRDRAATMAGFDVFRFTGSELWRDPLGCAEQVFGWALKGWE